MFYLLLFFYLFITAEGLSFERDKTNSTLSFNTFTAIVDLSRLIIHA